MTKKMLGGVGFFFITFILIQWLAMPDRGSDRDELVEDAPSGEFSNSLPIPYESLLMNLGGSGTKQGIMLGIYYTEETAIEKKKEMEAKLGEVTLWKAVDILQKKTYLLILGPYESKTETQKVLDNLMSEHRLSGQVIAYPE